MDNKIHFQIQTADSSVCDAMVNYINVPTADGEMGIMSRHTAVIAALTEGVIRYKVDDTFHYVAVSGGILSVANDEVIVLARCAENAETIDLARAQASEKRARERLESKREDIDHARAELSLHRALAREKAYELLHK